MSQQDGLTKFLWVIVQIRDPNGGCPWDLAQTHESLLKYFAEEVQEFIDSMRHEGPTSPHTWEELGDVMLQIGLHTRLAEEQGLTTFDEVCRRAADKLIARHPHVFDAAFPKFKTADEVARAWEQIKAHARSKNTQTETLERGTAQETLSVNPSLQGLPVPTSPALTTRADALDQIPRGLSPLLRSMRIGEKAAAFRFDWPDIPSVLDKVLEEVEEFVTAQAESDQRQKEEFGDILFSLAQYARKRGWDPDQLANEANQKFCGRFRNMEELIAKQNRNWDELSLEELEASWQATKALTLYH